MAFVEQLPIQIKETGGIGAVVDISQHSGKGYDFSRGVGAGFTSALEGSVAQRNWTTLVNLNVSSQGQIPSQYNYLRTNTTVAGALGTGTELVTAGRC